LELSLNRPISRAAEHAVSVSLGSSIPRIFLRLQRSVSRAIIRTLRDLIVILLLRINYESTVDRSGIVASMRI
jgi:hypothetical protein